MKSKRPTYVVRWTPKERKRLFDLLKDHSYQAAAVVLNDEFHGGFGIRSYHSTRGQWRLYSKIDATRINTVVVTKANMERYDSEKLYKDDSELKTIITISWKGGSVLSIMRRGSQLLIKFPDDRMIAVEEIVSPIHGNEKIVGYGR